MNRTMLEYGQDRNLSFELVEVWEILIYLQCGNSLTSGQSRDCVTLRLYSVCVTAIVRFPALSSGRLYSTSFPGLSFPRLEFSFRYDWLVSLPAFAASFWTRN